MASLSSTSVSSSNSLGNTSLRGFGGMASGIDRDAIIEQMTLGTNTKIESQKSNMTKLQWKQEAYRGITDQILDLTDKYASYSSTSNLKDPGLFSKSLITVQGAESATRFVTATGTSKLVENVAITAVKQLATATVRQSNAHVADALKTKELDLVNGLSTYSKLEGTTIQLGYYDNVNKKFVKDGEFKFNTSYTVSSGDKTETKKIDYLNTSSDELVKQLNEMAEAQNLSNRITFRIDSSSGKIRVDLKNENGSEDGAVMNANSTALSALGYTGNKNSKGISAKEFNDGVTKSLESASKGTTTVIDSLTGKNLIFEYDGSQKNIGLITAAEAEALKAIGEDGKLDGKDASTEQIQEARFAQLVKNLQSRLNKEYGEKAVTVEAKKGENGGYKLAFSTQPGHTISTLSSNGDLLNTLGIDFGESNKVNVDGKLGQAALGLDADVYTKANGQLDLVINGVSITGLTANSSISDIISKINSTTAAGVKATYVDATGQFMLVSNETGAGRDISLDSQLSKALFGGSGMDATGNLVNEKGDVIAKKDTLTGYFKTTDNKYVDSLGRYLAQDNEGNILEGIYKGENGKNVNAAGYVVDNSGRLIDKNGQLINKDGNLVDTKGRLITVVDDKGNGNRPEGDFYVRYDADGIGKIVTKGEDGTENELTGYQIRLINKDGHYVDTDGHLTDFEGRYVDADGNLINGKGQYWNLYKTDGDGDYLNEKGGKIKQAGDGKWYTVNNDGKFVDENNNELQYQDGKWYEVKDGSLGEVSARGPAGESERALIDKSVDKEGYYIDGTGNYLNEDGGKIKQAGDGKWYTVNNNDKFVDENDNELQYQDGEWRKVNDDGSIGEVSDKGPKGESGRYQAGKLIDKNGYWIDANNNYLNEDGKIIKQVGKNWYALDNGQIKNSEGNEVDYVGATWYLVNEDGTLQGKVNGVEKNALKYENGKWYEKVESETGGGSNEWKLVEGEVESTAGEVKTSAQSRVTNGPVAVSGLRTDGVINTGTPEKVKINELGGMSDNIKKGQNAIIQVSYGNGVTVDMERGSNTFNLEGLTVTVTGTFGGEYVDEYRFVKKKDDGSLEIADDEVIVYGEDGNQIEDENNNVKVKKTTWTPDSSQTVTFSAKADVDKALETVKAFFEDFNALVTEINSQITARPDSNYGPLTSAQKEEMDETSIENWEKKAKQGILFNDDVMRDLSGSMEGVLSKLMNKYGVNYQDLEKIGITYSEDYLDGGTLVFDESKFRSAMESDPELVSKIISGGESGGKGLIHVVEDSLTPYATRYASKNGNSYGRLVEVAGTEKKPTTLMSNQIYKQLKEMQETIDKLQAQLKVEQDRYISQFTTMESLINQMNTQSSYLSQIMA